MAANKLVSSELDKFYTPYLSDEDSNYSSDSESVQSKNSSSGSSTGASSTGASSTGASSSGSSTKIFENVIIPASESRQNIFNTNGSEISEVSKAPEPPKTGVSNTPLLFNQTTTAFTSSKVSNTIMLNSSDRDTTVFPEPSSFNIRLPRIYKNVTNISIGQIKMLSSFYFFNNTKNNTTVPIHESGRIIGQSKILNVINAVIRNGSYDSGSLPVELANQLNKAPIYSNITRFTFFQQFFTSGNFGLLFNDIGDTTYNILTNNFDSLNSKNDIVSRYFSSISTLGASLYTNNEMLVAYYYPMLRDFTIEFHRPKNSVMTKKSVKHCVDAVVNNDFVYDPFDYKQNDVSGSILLNGTNYYDKIVCGFSGLDDRYIYLLVKDISNQTILDIYKQNNSWNNCLLNNYSVKYNSQTGLLSITATSLNTSLVTTFNNQHDSIKSNELWKVQINPASASKKQKDINDENYAFSDMYTFLQNALSKTFAVDYGSFDPHFYANLSNKIFVNDGRGKYGWKTSYSGIQPLSANINNNVDSNGKFLNLAISSDLAQNTGNNLFYPTANGLAQYTFTQNAPSDLSGYILLNGGSEMSYGIVDISFNVLPTTYARILFTSKYRQTLYLSVLPSYNGSSEKYPLISRVNTPLLYDIFGNLLLDSNDSNYTFYTIRQNMLDGPDYMRTQINESGQVYLSFATQVKPVVNSLLTAGAFKINQSNPNLYFQINNGGYQVPQDSFNQITKFSSDIYIETETLGAPIGTKLDIYWYKDRALYMSDLTNILNGTGTNNPAYYFIHNSVNADSSGCMITVDFISFEQSYLMIRTNGVVPVSLRVFALRHNPYGVYETALEADLIKWPRTVVTEPSIQAQFPIIYPTVNLACGYDNNGISRNILDYCILMKNNINIDPRNLIENTNINNDPVDILCNSSSPSVVAPNYSESWSPFFYSGSQNRLYQKLNNSTYTNSVGNIKQYIFTNMFKSGMDTNLYDQTINPNNFPEKTFVPPLSNTPFSTFSVNNSLSPFILCYNSGFSYKTDIGVDSFFTGTNIMGIPFTPPPCKFCVPDSVTIKFSYIQPISSNDSIIGRRSVLKNTSLANFKMSNYSTNVSTSGADGWDDRYIKNRKNVILGVFMSKDILGKKQDTILLKNALCTMRLKKITQIGAYQTVTNGDSYIKMRNPEWGTYYIYERSNNPGALWYPVNSVSTNSDTTISWDTINIARDISGQIYTKNNTGIDLSGYYNDINNNSLCFIPFFLNNINNVAFDSSSWKVGAFDGLTYTELPYIPFVSSPVNTQNNTVYYNGGKMICIQDLNGYGLAAGSESLYLGSCGPVCWSVSSNGTVECPNYQNGILKPTFFNIKLNLFISDKTYNPLYDYSLFQTDISKCFIDSKMFVYNLTKRPDSDINDIKGAWGNERANSFIVSDDNSGPNYLSYINGLPVNTGETLSVLIRGNTPTVEFKGILRITGKNRFDFGWVTLQNLIDEIDVLKNNNVSIKLDGSILNIASVNNLGFTEAYIRCLLLFDSQFIGSYAFGLNTNNPNNATYSGITHTLTGFKDFMSKYVILNSKINTDSEYLSRADSMAMNGIKQFIKTNYSGIIPDIYLDRNRFTDALPFSIKFRSALNTANLNAFDKWGLGWNLGFDKIDTAYNTLQTASTFIRIVDDFIYLKLNDEFKMNGLDLSYKENLTATRDTVGVEGGYFGKLLLSPFGSYAQTFVQSSKPFVQPIPKIDKLKFSFYDSENRQIFNKDCEFNVVIDISEVVDTIDSNSLIIRGTGGLKAPGY